MVGGGDGRSPVKPAVADAVRRAGTRIGLRCLVFQHQLDERAGETVEGMRALLRGSLGKSLSAMSDEDRLAAAWTVVCGRVLSERGVVAGYAEGVVEVEVVDMVWLQQMKGMKQQLIRELAFTAKVPVRELRFLVRGTSRGHVSTEKGARSDGN